MFWISFLTLEFSSFPLSRSSGPFAAPCRPVSAFSSATAATSPLDIIALLASTARDCCNLCGFSAQHCVCRGLRPALGSSLEVEIAPTEASLSGHQSTRPPLAGLKLIGSGLTTHSTYLAVLNEEAVLLHPLFFLDIDRPVFLFMVFSLLAPQPTSTPAGNSAHLHAYVLYAMH